MDMYETFSRIINQTIRLVNSISAQIVYTKQRKNIFKRVVLQFPS